MKNVFFLFFTLLSFSFWNGCTSDRCSTSRDCEKGSFCNTHQICDYECKSSADCGFDRSCSTQGQCVAKTTTDGGVSPDSVQETKAQVCTTGEKKDCYEGILATKGVGVCVGGIQTCVDKVWSLCVGQVLASPEICDKKDNNCDGQVDEGLQGCGCTSNSDCPAGKPNCQAGICVQFCQSNSVCLESEMCKQGYCQPCSDGGNRTQKEECNGKDDNCDGTIDENLTKSCGSSSDVGACKKGTQICDAGVWGSCVGEVKAIAELCNNKDDDCNGKIDDKLTKSCGSSSDVGACKKGIQTCDAGVWGSCVGEIKSVAETCNNKDDDCNGKIDDNLTKSCGSSNAGECKKGIQTCDAGIWGACKGETQAITELCNGKDDNCNGSIDENLSQSCGSDIGECKKGTQICNAGVWGTCQGEIPAIAESCNGKDDDCNGTIDDVANNCFVLFKKLSTQNFSYSVSFSPDGKTLASGSSDKTIQLWDVATGSVLKIFSGHTDYVRSVAFSPDGKTLASGSPDKTIKLWDVATGALLQTLSGHVHYIQSVSFSPDGKTLVSGSSDKTIKLWDVATGTLSQTLSGHTDYVRSVVFSPDGKTLASGSSDKTIWLWNVSTNKLKAKMLHTNEIMSISFSPDGKFLVSGSLDKTVQLWEIASGKKTKTFSGHTDTVMSVVFSPDGKTIASGGWDKTIKIWDFTAGTLLKTLSEHTKTVTSVVFSPDGKTFASGSTDKTIRLWR